MQQVAGRSSLTHEVRKLGNTPAASASGIYCASGNHGAAGTDTLRGGTGDDTFYAYDGKRDVIDGGAGNDHGWYDGSLDKVRNVERRG